MRVILCAYVCMSATCVYVSSKSRNVFCKEMYFPQLCKYSDIHSDSPYPGTLGPGTVRNSETAVTGIIA